MQVDHVKAGRDVIVSIGGRATAHRVPVPSEQAPADYVDRPELTGPLLAHLLSDQPTPKGRAIISAVHGLGGIGKTTVAQSLVWRPEIESRFPDGRIWVTLGNEPPEANTVLNDCASKELMVASPRSRFLLTTRFPQLTDDPAIGAKDFSLDEMNVDQALELIVRALRRELNPDEQALAKRLCEIVGGHPLALELAAALIKKRRSWKTLLDDLAAEVARLEALEEVDDGLVAQPSGSEPSKRGSSVRASLLLSVRYLTPEGQRLFAWLGVVAEDAIITARMAATLWSKEEQDADRCLRTLSGLGLLSARADGYSIHDLMHDLARELLTAPEAPVRAGRNPGFGLTLQDAHRQLLGRYKAKTTHGLWHTLPDDGYFHDHLVRHFEQAGLERDLEGLLWEESADGHCGWYQAREGLGQTAGFLADVGRVWSYADRLGAAAATEPHRAQAIALQLHCALIIASINSLSARIPIEVLVGAVRCGMLPLASASALARQHPDPFRRVDLLLALENETRRSHQPSVLREALAVARGIDHAGSRAQALARVARRLPADEQRRVLGEALGAARSIVHEGWRARALVLAEVAQHLPAEEALAVARGIDEARSRAQALAEVAERLPAQEQPPVLGEALSAARSIDEARMRAQALAEVAERLPAQEQRPSVLGEALAVARGIDDAGSRARVLAEVALRLPAEERPSVIREALEVARGIEGARTRAVTLAEVAQRLPAEDALAVAHGIDDAERRAWALAEVAKRLPAEEALAVARGIDEAEKRAEALAEVARRLPADRQPLDLREAVSALRRIGDAGSRAGALAAVAQHLPAAEALAVAHGIDDAEKRAEALAETAQRLPADDQPRALGEALSAARCIEGARTRAEALAQVARRLPADEQRRVLGEALSAARDIDDAGPRVQALAEVGQWLPGEDQPRVLGEALRLARGVDHARLRSWALARVATRLPAEDQPRVLGEALSAALGISDAGSRARALAEVAERLPAAEALAVARGIDDARTRAWMLAGVAPRLPAEEALAVVSGIDDEELRAGALAEVAQHLPAAEALAVARGISDARSRARALSDIAKRLPAEERPSVLREALSAARGVDDARRSWALVEITPRLPAEQALAVARGVDDAGARVAALAEAAQRLPAEDQPRVLGEALSAALGISDAGSRARALADVAQRYDPGQISGSSMRQWAETARALAMHKRSECVADFAAILTFIHALGGESAVRSLGRSIVAVGTWWP